jgi:hypothetical protein
MNAGLQLELIRKDWVGSAVSKRMVLVVYCKNCAAVAKSRIRHEIRKS